jgi:hypothetical protein
MSEINIEWVEVPTHRGYFVTRSGMMRGPTGVVLRPMKTDGGHRYVLASPPRRPRKLFVHRAVLFAFAGPPPPGMEVRHLDGDPGNNAIENLAWGTRLENMQDKARHGTERQGEEKPGCRLTAANVDAIRFDRRASRVVGAEYGVSHTAVQRIRRGERWRAA